MTAEVVLADVSPVRHSGALVEMPGSLGAQVAPVGRPDFLGDQGVAVGRAAVGIIDPLEDVGAPGDQNCLVDQRERRDFQGDLRALGSPAKQTLEGAGGC